MTEGHGTTGVLLGLAAMVVGPGEMTLWSIVPARDVTCEKCPGERCYLWEVSLVRGVVSERRAEVSSVRGVQRPHGWG